MKHSLSLRLLISASIVLAAFFGIAGIVLENAFIRGAEQATKERLQTQIYALLAAADLNQEGRLGLPEHLPEPRYSIPGSGLYAKIFNHRLHTVWRSASTIGIELRPLQHLKPGQVEFITDDSDHFVLYYPLVWEDEYGTTKTFLFAVAEDTDAVQMEISGFSDTLWRWLGGIGLILVIVQVGILAWSLRPLRALSKEIEEIEAGAKARLSQDYPKELQGVTLNINTLLDAERSNLERHRKTLANLAHSLKTPLAILRGCCNVPGLPDTAKSTLTEQISRMDELIEYQLQSAAARGKNRLAQWIPIAPVIEKLIDAMKKVYADKSPRMQLRITRNLQFACEEGDLTEIVGNLIDNACKWCKRAIRITVEYRTEPSGLRILVEDDGPGIPEDQLKDVLRRGVRADEQIRGHGIGLAVVYDMVRLSQGRMEAGISELGGLRWNIWLPGRGGNSEPLI